MFALISKSTLTGLGVATALSITAFSHAQTPAETTPHNLTADTATEVSVGRRRVWFASHEVQQDDVAVGRRRVWFAKNEPTQDDVAVGRRRVWFG